MWSSKCRFACLRYVDGYFWWVACPQVGANSYWPHGHTYIFKLSLLKPSPPPHPTPCNSKHFLILLYCLQEWDSPLPRLSSYRVRQEGSLPNSGMSESLRSKPGSLLFSGNRGVSRPPSPPQARCSRAKCEVESKFRWLVVIAMSQEPWNLKPEMFCIISALNCWNLSHQESGWFFIFYFFRLSRIWGLGSPHVQEVQREGGKITPTLHFSCLWHFQGKSDPFLALIPQLSFLNLPLQ